MAGEATLPYCDDGETMIMGAVASVVGVGAEVGAEMGCMTCMLVACFLCPQRASPPQGRG